MSSEDLYIEEDIIQGIESLEDEYYLDMLPKGYLSVSQISQFLKCGEAYKRRYVLEEPTPKNAYMVQGSGVHKAAELLHISMIHNSPMTEEEVTSAYSDYHDEKIQDAIIPEELESEGKTKDVGIRLTKSYYKGATQGGEDPQTGLPFAPLEPVAAERVLKVKLQSETFENIPFIAVVDLEEEASVSDIKVKGKPVSTGDVEDSLQLSLYAHITGKPTVRLDQLVRPTKTKPVRYIRREAIKTKSETLHAVDIAAEVASDIAAGRFRKTNPENWWCSAKWCPFWDVCRGRER